MLTPQSLPALQRACRPCLTCGAPADAYCAGCGLTPYCSTRCQQADWTRRHRNVCHNLARLQIDASENKAVAVPAAEPTAPAALRPPRSPAAAAAATPPAPRRETSDDRPRKNYVPAGDAAPQAGAGPSNKQPYNRNKSFKNQTFRRPMTGRLNDARDDEEESFEPKVEPKAAAQPKPVPKPAENVPSTSQQSAKNVPKSEPVPSHQPTKSVPKPEPGPSHQPAKSVPKPEPVPSHQPAKSVPKPEPEPVPVKKEPAVAKVETVPKVKTVAPDAPAPARKIVPTNYMIGTLDIGESVMLSVDAQASECRSEASGFVCLSLHEKSQEDYQLLCEEYSEACEAAGDCKPNPGELFSYYYPDDEAYYRARCLGPSSAALIDSSKVVALTPADKCKSMPPKYEAIVEFCCVLDAPNIKIGDNLLITLKSKSARGFKVQVGNAEGEVFRWTPRVDYPVPTPAPAPAPAAVVLPEVPRPALRNNCTVVLVQASGAERLLLRPADTDSLRKFDMALQDVVEYAMKASPMKEPPQQGQVVIGKFKDGNFYRALVRRTNFKLNKYQLEFIEYGNVDVNPRESIYECPPRLDLSARPTVVSAARLSVAAPALSPAAQEYLVKLTDTNTELVLSLPDGAKSAPSGAEVKLTVAQNKESVNKKVELMCTPDWKKIEEKGGDVVDLKPLMFSDLELLELPAEGCEIDVLDASIIGKGVLNGCQSVAGATAALEALTKQMEEYCNSELGKMPYLPKLEELCIAQFPPGPQWYRAVMLEQVDGPGGGEARVCYVDYGNVAEVPVAVLRKMLPEFVRGHPALASQLEIRNFPAAPTNAMLAKALLHMKIDEDGRGILKVTRCEKLDSGLYKVDAPDLLKAMGVE